MIWWSLGAFLPLFLVPLTSTWLLTCSAILDFLFMFTVESVSCYYSNSTAAFQRENTPLTCGDIHPNPGWTKADNSDSNAKSGSNSKSKFKFPCKVCDKPVKSKQRVYYAMNAVIGIILNALECYNMAITSTVRWRLLVLHGAAVIVVCQILRLVLRRVTLM